MYIFWFDYVDIYSVVELIGDVILDMCVIVKVDVIVIILEKWDGISWSW